MSQLNRVDVRVRSDGEASAQGWLEITSFDRSERVRRAARWWAGGWGLAVLSILVPLAHWVLVPGFLLGTPFAALWKFGEEKVVSGGEVTCPGCGSAFKVEPGHARFPYRDTCSQCKGMVSLEPA
jgi:hypothetical protein